MVSVGSRLTACCRHFGIRSQSGIQLFWDIGQFLALESYLPIQNYVIILVLTRHQQPPDALPRLLSFLYTFKLSVCKQIVFLAGKKQLITYLSCMFLCFYLWFRLLLRNSHLEGITSLVVCVRGPCFVLLQSSTLVDHLLFFLESFYPKMGSFHG
jgi:hypothetical protein